MRAFTSFLVGAGVGVLLAMVFAARLDRRTEEVEWDKVDEASAESFPASDSPGY